MGAPWILVKAFLREATEGDDYQPLSSVEGVYARLRAIQSGHFTTATSSDGLVQISSTIGSTSFGFQAPSKLDRAQIIEIAESALELIDGMTTVAQIRGLLARTKTTRTDFSRWCPQ